MKDRIFFACVFAYALCAVLTFGHAAANTECTRDRVQECTEEAALNGALAGLVWPLYWSWVAFDADGQHG
jgi:hypothetical protein